MGHRPGLHERLLEFIAAASLAGALVISFVSHRLDWMLIPITIGIALLQIGLAWAMHWAVNRFNRSRPSEATNTALSTQRASTASGSRAVDRGTSI